MKMRRPVALLAAFVLVLGSVGQAAAAGGSSADKAKLYYLSVGDSLAAGVQPIGEPGRPVPDRPRLRGTAPPDRPRAVSQAGAGEARLSRRDDHDDDRRRHLHLRRRLAARRGRRVPPRATASSSRSSRSTSARTTSRARPRSASRPASATIQSNLPTILAELREAAGPDVPIVGMTLYNPFLANWLTGPDGPGDRAGQRDAADGTRSTASCADLRLGRRSASPISRPSSRRTTSTTQVDLPGAGTVPLNVARICMWTWVCAPAPYGPDNHANEAGYGAIAHAFAIQLGL